LCWSQPLEQDKITLDIETFHNRIYIEKVI
jgi:hypothetical protein